MCAKYLIDIRYLIKWSNIQHDLANYFIRFAFYFVSGVNLSDLIKKDYTMQKKITLCSHSSEQPTSKINYSVKKIFVHTSS